MLFYTDSENKTSAQETNSHRGVPSRAYDARSGGQPGHRILYLLDLAQTSNTFQWLMRYRTIGVVLDDPMLALR